jgi:amicyanin
MRRIVPAFAAGLALVVPSLAIAAGEVLDDAPPAASSAAADEPALTPENVAPKAELTATIEGDEVVLDASKSADSDGRIVLYEWDLDADEVYEDKTLEPKMRTTYAPGTTAAPSVRAIDDAGAGGEASTSVTVPAAAPAEPPAEPAPAPEPKPEPQAAEPEATAPAAEPPAEPRRTDVEPAPKEVQDEDEPTIVAAANGSVTIKDFDFAPATVTIGVGDSVTWVNQGPTVHTATAGGGEFDSGNLNDGQSFSHKFTKAGTFNYICTPHPFMQGKVVVTASGSSGGSGNDTGSSDDDASGTADATASGTSGELAQTGADLYIWLLVGGAMLACGGALRWRVGPVA